MGTINYYRDGHVGILSLDRPEKLNAMTHEMGDAIRALVPRLNADPDLRVLIVRGEGRAFSAGGDLGFLVDNAQKPLAENQTGMQDFYGKFLALREIDVPTIAVLQGRATGAGLCFALGCDIRLAAENALLSANFVRVGLSPGMGGTWTLPRLIGPARAAELLFTGRAVDAAEALALGLVNAVHPTDALMDAAHAMANEIAKAAPAAVKATKALLRRNARLELPEALEGEAIAQAGCFASADLQEGVAAIREKRSPEFTGA